MGRRQEKIVSLDPWGHLVGDVFRDHLARGYDVRPTIAVTRAHIDMPEIRARHHGAARSRPTATSCRPTAMSGW